MYRDKKIEFKEIIKYNNNFAIKFKQDKNVLNKMLSDIGNFDSIDKPRKMMLEEKVKLDSSKL